MVEYELHQYRAAELIRQAEHQRRVREALRALRSDTRSGTAPESHTHRFRRLRYTRAA